jgi:hypothetical protein
MPLPPPVSLIAISPRHYFAIITTPFLFFVIFFFIVDATFTLALPRAGAMPRCRSARRREAARAPCAQRALLMLRASVERAIDTRCASALSRCATPLRFLRHHHFLRYAIFFPD